MKLELLAHDSGETYGLNEQGVMSLMSTMQEQHNAVRQLVSLKTVFMISVFCQI